MEANFLPFDGSPKVLFYISIQLRGSTVVLGCSVPSASEESPFETALDKVLTVQFWGLSMCTFLVFPNSLALTIDCFVNYVYQDKLRKTNNSL